MREYEYLWAVQNPSYCCLCQDHPNIVKLFETFETPHEVYLVKEWAHILNQRTLYRWWDTTEVNDSEDLGNHVHVASIIVLLHNDYQLAPFWWWIIEQQYISIYILSLSNILKMVLYILTIWNAIGHSLQYEWSLYSRPYRLCQGGELFDRITSFGRLSEPSACFVMRQVLSAIAYLQSVGISHR